MQSKMAEDARNSRLEAFRLRAEEKVPMGADMESFLILEILSLACRTDVLRQTSRSSSLRGLFVHCIYPGNAG